MASIESTSHALDPPVLPPNTGPNLLELYQMNDLAAWNHSDEDICSAARLAWRSRVYDHFDLGIQRVYRLNSTGIRVPDYIQYTFTCKVDPNRCQMRTRKRKATGSWGTQNLKGAIQRCDKRRGVPDSLSVAQPTVVFSQAKFRALLCVWCAVSRRPFHILMDAIFLEIVFLLRPEAVVPCPQTISSDLARIYNRSSIRIREAFMQFETAMHLAIDGWTSPLATSFLGVIVFWRQGGVMWHSILEFIPLSESHTGAYLAEKTLECLERFGIERHIQSICLDNAKSNDTFVRKIAPALPNFRGEKTRSRCMPHIVNLAAKAFMSPFTRPPVKKRRIAAMPTANSARRSAVGASASAQAHPRETATGEAPFSTIDAPEPPLDDLDAIRDIPSEELDDGMEEFDNATAQQAVITALEEMQQRYGVRVSAEELKEARDLLTKVNGFAHHILRSPKMLTVFGRLLATIVPPLPTNQERPTGHCSTRWNSQLAAAESHRDLRPVIEMMTASSEYKVSRYRLDSAQWLLLSTLCDCLAVFLEPTLIFSQTDRPLIHEVVPHMELLRFRLTLMRDDSKNELKPIMRVAAHSALIVVDKYLKLMEESDIYWMSVALCPWYKLDYFITRDYTTERVREIHQMLLDQFIRSCPAPTSSTDSQAPPAPLAPQVNRWMQTPTFSTTRSASSAAPVQNAALTTYLTSPPLEKIEVECMGGLMGYWTAEESRGNPVAGMALDILTSPASSVDAERAFSGGRLAVNYRQHRTSLSTFRAKMAIGSWYGTPLLEDIDEVLHILNENGPEDDEIVELLEDLEV